MRGIYISCYMLYILFDKHIEIYFFNFKMLFIYNHDKRLKYLLNIFFYIKLKYYIYNVLSLEKQLYA
jgi:hypothetical protein